MSANDSTPSLRSRATCAVKGHDWRFHWADRTKTCRRCDVEDAIEKEYTHKDESAEIGGTRLVVKEREQGSPYRVERQTYRKTAHGPDDAWFQWFPDSGFYTDEAGLVDLRSEIDQVLQSETRDGNDN